MPKSKKSDLTGVVMWAAIIPAVLGVPAGNRFFLRKNLREL